jgi:glycosyltransferase involved in cell wall biosynthesis
MPKKLDILCFGPSDWWGMNPSCGTHIMRHLSAGNRIIYVNPFSSDLLGVRSRKGLACRIARKLKSYFRFVRKVQPDFYVVSLVFLPVQGVPLFDWLNNVAIKLQLKLLLKVLRFDKPLVWVENLRAASLLSTVKSRLTVYHVSDRFAECPYTKNREVLRRREAEVTAKADLLICVSRQLYDAKRVEHPNVHYLPHGVDYQLFRDAAEASRTYPGLSKQGRRIAGYYGTLTALNHIDLLTHCARTLTDIQFVFAGQITAGDYTSLQQLENVTFLGKLPYNDIPALCASFDVCLLPWRMTEWIRHCNPLKFFEYMASGKPIVSVPIAEIAENYSDMVSIAETPEAFCEAIGRELAQDTPERSRRRVAAANEHSWTNHAKKLAQIIEEALADRKDDGHDVKVASAAVMERNES